MPQDYYRGRDKKRNNSLPRIVEEIFELAADLHGYESQIEKLIKQIPGLIERAMQAATDKEKAAHKLYWLHPSFAYPLKRCCAALKVKHKIKPNQVDAECLWCQEPIAIEIPTWSIYKLLKQAYSEKTSGCDKSVLPRALCEKCRKKLKARNDASHNERVAQREAEEAEIKRLRALPYAEYLKTDHWQKCRRWALQWARYRCQVCNTDKEVLDTHHRTYANLGQERPEDLIILCRTCHNKAPRCAKD